MVAMHIVLSDNQRAVLGADGRVLLERPPQVSTCFTGGKVSVTVNGKKLRSPIKPDNGRLESIDGAVVTYYERGELVTRDFEDECGSSSVPMCWIGAGVETFDVDVSGSAQLEVATDATALLARCVEMRVRDYGAVLVWSTNNGNGVTLHADCKMLVRDHGTVKFMSVSGYSPSNLARGAKRKRVSAPAPSD